MGVTQPPIPEVQLPTTTGIVTAWPRCVQWAAAALLGLATVLLVVQNIAQLGQGLYPANLSRVESAPYQIDLNTADRAELLQLPAVGESLAQRILDYRQEHGGFHRVEDLRRVKGIGPLTMEKLRPWICATETREPETDEEASPRPLPVSVAATANSVAAERGTPSKKLTKDDVLLNINRATADELKRLPGVGPKLAEAIVTAREKKPFDSVDELRRVKGVGPKTLEKVRPFVIVGTGRLDLAAGE